MKNNKYIIDAKSLRIGNYLYDNEVGCKMEFKVTADDIRYIAHGKNHEYSYLQITHEWLERLGFTKVSFDDGTDGHYYEINLSDDPHYDIALLEGDKDGVVEVFLFPYDNIRFQYIHQIQNVFYAITGKELTITDTKP